jgi:hypothetical protein
MKTSLTVLALALCHGIACAELKWDRNRVELAAGPGDELVEATFGFVNTGSEPVTIEKIESSCGCTTASMPKMTFAPGERSQLTARFDTVGRRGLQTKAVTVHIKGEKDPVILSLAVTIPDLLKINPPLVAWEQGEAAKSKTIALDVMEGQSVNITSVISSDAHFTTKIETIREGRQYVIVVTPDTTAAMSFSALTINAEFKGQKPIVRAYAQVKGVPQ